VRELSGGICRGSFWIIQIESPGRALPEKLYNAALFDAIESSGARMFFAPLCV
jgi:hypothetical protein